MSEIVRGSVEIDPAVCQGHAICFMLASELFDVDEEGRGWVIDSRPSGELWDKARTAVDRCPEGAIRLDEVDDDASSDH